MQKYKVEYNKHKYQDMSDTPKLSSVVIEAGTNEDAGYILADIRNNTTIDGIRTKQGNRYYIGLIHFQSIEAR